MKTTRPILLALLFILASCAPQNACKEKKKWPPPPRPGDAGRVDHYQCARCHEAPGVLTPAPRDKNCVTCHQAIFNGGFDEEYPSTKIASWKRHIKHLRLVPSLTDLDKRYRREWLKDFLLSPHDLRPGLRAQMPRFEMSEADAEAIARHLIPTTPEKERAPIEGDAERGAARMAELGCMTCHRFTGARPIEASELTVEMGGEELANAIMLAPDLAVTRARMRADVVVAWLANPAALKQDAMMPVIPMSDQDRRDITSFIMTSPLEPEAKEPMPERLPLLKREVGWAEVQLRVFKKICWHCHSDPEPVGGDGGPGNTGGLGFKGSGLDLGTYEAIKRGGRDPDTGERIDVLAPRPGGDVPRVVEHMMARHAEVRGDVIEGVRGMPLGLTPMTPVEIQLVESWIAQGAKK